MAKNSAAQAEETTSAVARPMTNALAITSADLIRESGAGLEEVGGDDIAVPYFSIIQKQSKMMDNPAFTGKPGMFMHTITKELYDGQRGIDVIPCHFRRFWREITKDVKSPKFIAEHPAGWPTAKGASFDSALRRHICHDGTHANQIMRFFVLVVAPCEEPQPACLTFKGSQIKVAKNWNSMLSVMKMVVATEDGPVKINRPTYGSIWNLSTIFRQKDEDTWYGYEIASKGLLDPVGSEYDADIWSRGRDFHDMVNSGNVEEVGDEDA